MYPYSRTYKQWYFQLSYLKCLVTVLVDAHSLAVFKRGNRTEGKRAGARDGDRKARERAEFTNRRRVLFGAKSTCSRASRRSLFVRAFTLVCPKNIASGGHRRASPRLDLSTHNVTRQKLSAKLINQQLET